MKYINRLALLALAILGLGLQASAEDTDTAAEAKGWSLPAKIGMGLVGGTAAAGALGVGGYALSEQLKLRAAQQAANSAVQAAGTAAQAVDVASQAFKNVSEGGNDLPTYITDYYTASNALSQATDAAAQASSAAAQANANLQNVQGSMYSAIPSVQDIRGAVSNWWHGPQQVQQVQQVQPRIYYPSIDPELGGSAYGRLAGEAYFPVTNRSLDMPEFAESLSPYVAPAPIMAAPAAPWYSPIMNAPSAISSRWGALDPYSKVGAALAGAALLGGGVYGLNRLYQGYRRENMPAVEKALAQVVMSDEQNQEILNILLTMADLIKGEGREQKINGNLARLAYLRDYIKALNGTNFSTIQLASMVDDLENEFKAARASDYSAIRKDDKRRKIMGQYQSLSNLLADQIRNLQR